VLAFRGRPRTASIREVRGSLLSLIEEHEPQLLVVDLRSLRGGFHPELVSVLVFAYARVRRPGDARACRLLGKGPAGHRTEMMLRLMKVLPLFGGHAFADLESALDSVESDRSWPASKALSTSERS
jgi:hypothetical protein